MWIVNWLIDQWAKLNLFFTTLWSAAVELALYGLGAIKSLVSGWVEWLKNLIYYYVGQLGVALETAKAWLAGLIQTARDVASTALQSARDWLFGLIVNVGAAADAALKTARDWLLGVIQNVSDSIRADLAGLGNWINAQITAVLNYAYELGNQALGAINSLQSWINANILAPLLGVAGELAAFRQTWESVLNGFFSSPGRFIFGVLEVYVYTWAEWFVANLLGGVNIPPPPKLDFFHSDPGGPVYTASGALAPDPIYARPLPGLLGVIHPFTPHEPFVIFRASPNDPAASLATGRVIGAGYDPSFLGYHLTLDFGDGFTARYAYMDILFVARGDRVEVMQPLGTAGNSGAAPGLSLRLELFYRGAPIDPIQFINL